MSTLNDKKTTNGFKTGTENESKDNNSAAKNMGNRNTKGTSLLHSTPLYTEQQSDYALFCLSEKNPIRRFCRMVVESKTFEYFILLVIIANCVSLALNAPLPNEDKSELGDALEDAEAFFLSIFLMEMLLKTLALGFILHPGSYLRNGWNIIDFLVVVIGFASSNWIISSESSGMDVKALRAVRVLRPLKLVSGVPSLQVVMKSIMRAMVPLLQILLLVLFVILIYAIVGLSFLMGKFHQTCYYANDTMVWSGTDIRPCGNTSDFVSGDPCPVGSTCRRLKIGEWPGPNDGITSFDNIALAMLTVFQCITMEGWTEIMYKTFEAVDSGGYVYSLYYVSLIIIGSFFMLNLVLGVLSGEFAKERERVETRNAFFKVRRQQQFERQVGSYLEWLTKAEEIMLDEEENELEEQKEITGSKSQLVPGQILGRTINMFKRKRRDKPDSERGPTFHEFRQKEKRFRIRVRKLVKSQKFYWLVIIVVFLNTVVAASLHYDQPDWMTEFQEWAEIVFLALFIVEMMLKMYGLGIMIYFASSFNCFDCVVIVLGVIDWTLGQIVHIQVGVSVLRCLRLLRVFKVTRYWASLRNLGTSLVSSIQSIMSLIFLLFLFIVITALLGVQFFGGRFRGKGMDNTRTNFDTFPNGMLAVFQILTGEDWNAVMYNGVKAYIGDDGLSAKAVASSLYFVLLVVFGNYTLLNVFLAIAVDNLANAQILTKDEEQEDEAREEAKRERHTQKKKGWDIPRRLPMLLVFTKHNQNQTSVESADSNGIEEDKTKPSSIENDTNSNPVVNGIGKMRSRAMSKQLEKSIGVFRQKQLAESHQNGKTRHLKKQDTTLTEENEGEEGVAGKISGKNFMKTLKSGTRRRRMRRKVAPIIRTKALFIFGPESNLRRLCHKIVNFRYFDNFMLLVIFMSSLILALEDPVVENSNWNNILSYFDYVFTAIFFIEVVIKLIDSGGIVHSGAYFRNGWNCIDFVVVICNVTSIILSHVPNLSPRAIQIFKILKVLRVLRPLRIIHRVKKLEAVFRCMLYSLKNVANILLITLIFLFIFAVLGVQLFNGKFWECTDVAMKTRDDCRGNYFEYTYDGTADELSDPVIKKREWLLKEFNFDNVMNATLTLFTSSTGEGWPSAMYSTMDVTSYDTGPEQDKNAYFAVFYISFVVVFSFFFLNIFVALIILTFQEQGEKEIVDGELDRNQRDCIQFAMNAKPMERFMPHDKSTMSYKVWLVVASKPFEIFIMILIGLNTVVLVLSYDGESETYKAVCEIFNTVFTVLFTLEAMLKLFSYRLNYFRDSWNVFDFVIVIGSLLDTILTYMDELPDFLLAFDTSMFRLFRAARLIKLLRQGYSVRILLWTFFQSLKALPYVTLLIMLVFFMYAVIGMQLFGKINLDKTTEINAHNNFRTIIQAFQVLFRSSTGENWQLIMVGCYDSAQCDPAVTTTTACGSTEGARAYFCSFIFLCMFLMLNLFVAVIMDNFEYLTRDESILGPHHLDEFVRVWSEHDPGATGSIHHNKVYKLMCSMSPPVGFGKKCPKIVGYKRLIKMNMPLNDDNTVNFTTTLFALIRTSLNIKVEGNMNANDTDLRKMIKRVWPKTMKPTLDKLIPKQSVLSSQQMTIGKIYCARLIYENYKYLKKKRGELQGLDGKQSRVKHLKQHAFAPSSKSKSSSTPALEQHKTGGFFSGLFGGNKNSPPESSLAQAHSAPGLQSDSPKKKLPKRRLSEVSINVDEGAPENANINQETYFDDMIGRINQQLASAIQKGQSPYYIYGLEEDDEDDWC